MDNPPDLVDWEKKLSDICKDFLTRGGVYQLDGVDKFDEYFDQQIKP